MVNATRMMNNSVQEKVLTSSRSFLLAGYKVTVEETTTHKIYKTRIQRQHLVKLKPNCYLNGAVLVTTSSIKDFKVTCTPVECSSATPLSEQLLRALIQRTISPPSSLPTPSSNVSVNNSSTNNAILQAPSSSEEEYCWTCELSNTCCRRCNTSSRCCNKNNCTEQSAMPSSSTSLLVNIPDKNTN